MRSICWGALTALVGPLVYSALAFAEEPADSRAAAFQAMQGAQREDVPGGSLLVYAYGFILCLFIAYLARIAVMQGKTAADLERLSAALEKQAKKA